jgi:hypothetical protein
MEEPYDSLAKSNKIQLQEISDVVGLIKMGLANRVDAVYLDKAIGKYLTVPF